MSHGDYDDFWKNSRLERGRSPGRVQGRSRVSHHRLVRLVGHAGREPELRRAAKGEEEPAAADRRAVDSQRGRRSSYAGEAQFTDDAALDLNALRLRWFDHWLKGMDNGVDREPPVRIYVMGGGDAHKTPEGRVFVGGHWRDEQEWPLARATATPYYLHADGALSPDKPADRRAHHVTCSIRAIRCRRSAAMSLRRER